MTLYYISTGQGCCIRSARDENHAVDMVLAEVGTDCGVESVREATKQDLAWVLGMGGRVPKDTHGNKLEAMK